MEIIRISEQVMPRLLEEQYADLLEERTQYVKRMPGRNGDDAFCYRIIKSENEAHIESTYFVGLDWVTDDFAVQVLPKMDGQDYSIDYMQMLMDALQEPENVNYLKNLVHIDFEAKPIPLSQAEDHLTPFIVAQFIMTLKKAARKGLRRSYYSVTNNLRSKIKGKILVNQTILKNHTKGSIMDSVCSYQEYGVDSEENRLLKYALNLSRKMLTGIKGGIDVMPLMKEIALVNPYFREVSDNFDPSYCRPNSFNPIFKDYYQAMELAKLLIRRSAYGFQKDSNQVHATPPYWIDMSKLFELYVLKRLREYYGPKEVRYQERIGGYYPDYLIVPSNGEEPFIIDAKYKPRYAYSYDIDDVRQVSGYARMKGVFDKMAIEDKTTMIKCLIVYPNQNMSENLGGRIYPAACDEIKLFYDIYKLGIKVPEKR